MADYSDADMLEAAQMYGLSMPSGVEYDDNDMAEAAQMYGLGNLPGAQVGAPVMSLGGDDPFQLGAAQNVFLEEMQAPQQPMLPMPTAAPPTEFEVMGDMVGGQPWIPTPAEPPHGFRQMVGQGVQSAADALSNMLGGPWLDNPKKAVQEAQGMSFAERLPYATSSTILGGAGLVDALANVPLWAGQWMAGVAPEKRIKSDIKGNLQKSDFQKQLKEKAPHLYDQMTGQADLVVPIAAPFVSAAGTAGKIIPQAAKWAQGVKAGATLPTLADLAVTGGLGGFGTAVNEAMKGKEEVDPLTALLMTGQGAGLGLGFGAAGALTSKLIKALAGKKQPQPQGPAPTTPGGASSEEEILRALGLAPAAPGTPPQAPLAPVPVMPSTPPPPVPTAPQMPLAPAASPIQQILDRIVQSTPENVHEALDDAAKFISRKGLPKSYRQDVRRQVDEAYQQHTQNQQAGAEPPAAAPPATAQPSKGEKGDFGGNFRPDWQKRMDKARNMRAWAEKQKAQQAPTEVPPVEQPAPPPVTPEVGGPFRQRLAKGAQGYNKPDSFPTIDELPIQASDDLRNAAQGLATLQASRKYHEAIEQDFAERLWKRLEDLGLAKDGQLVYKSEKGLILTKKRDQELTAAAKRQLEKLKDELATGVKPVDESKMSIETNLGAGFGEERALQIDRVKLPDDVNQAVDTLAKLHKNVLTARTNYSDYSAKAKPVFQQHHDALTAQDPQSSLAFRVSAKTPKGEDVEPGIVYRKPQMERVLDEKAQASVKALEQQLKADNKNLTWNISFNVNTKGLKNKALLALTGSVAAADQAAQAADGTEQQQPQGFNWGAAARIGFAGAMFHKLAPGAARKLLTTTNLKGNTLFSDTMDGVQWLDKSMKSDVSRKMWEEMANVMKASWGVKFDKVVRQKAMDALRDGDKAKIVEALKPLNKEQQDALIAYNTSLGKMKTLVSDQLKKAKEFKAALEAKGMSAKHLDGGIESLEFMNNVLSPRASTSSWIDRQYRKLMSNFMDYSFFWNPEFHGTNASDSFIAGGSRVGLKNVTRSWQLLGPGGDKQLKAIFNKSNLVGSFEAERVDASVKAGKKFFPDSDIASDKLNADRVALGSLLQYGQTKAKLNGWAGTDVDFAKAVMTDKNIDPTLAMDAWVHMTETMSRTLGVDPFRVNMDAMSRWAHAPALGVFVKQPARISRLALNYLAEGNLKAFYTMMGVTAAIGGKAAIPKDAAIAWETVDPDSYFMTAAALESADLWQAATGNDLSPKVQWGILYPLMMSQNPVGESLGDLGEGGFKVLQKYADGKDFSNDALGESGKILMMFHPRIKGVPTRAGVTAVRTGMTLAKGERDITATDAKGLPVGREKINLADQGINPLKYFVDQNLLPGLQGEEEDIKTAAVEAKKRTEAPLNKVLMGKDATDRSNFRRPEGPRFRQIDLINDLMGSRK